MPTSTAFKSAAAIGSVSATGYGIYRLLESNTEVIMMELRNKAQEAKFNPLKTDTEDDDSKWEAIIRKSPQASARSSTVSQQIKNLKSECKSFKESNRLKEFIKKCTELITIKERAIALNLAPIEANEKLESKLTGENSEEITQIISGLKTTYQIELDGTDTKTKQIDYCKKVGKLTHLDVIDITVVWKEYLTTCTESQIKKNYWNEEILVK